MFIKPVFKVIELLVRALICSQDSNTFNDKLFEKHINIVFSEYSQGFRLKRIVSNKSNLKFCFESAIVLKNSNKITITLVFRQIHYCFEEN